MSLIISLIESAQDHYPWVLLIVFLLTFTKSCALVSLAIPAPPACCCWGHSLPPASDISLMWSSASLGAIGGFWLSWRLGIRYRHRLPHLRWLTAERLARSRLFFQRYGPWAIFFSRFLLSPRGLRCPSLAAPAVCRCGRFSWLTSAPVCCGRFCCSPPALSASVCGEKTLSFKEIPQVRDML